MASGTDLGDRTRFAKLGIAIGDVLTQACRDVLEMEVPPERLSSLVNKLRFRIQINRTYMDQISSAKNYGYKDFDIPLSYFLIRNICTNIHPLRGWGRDPEVEEKTIGGDIERIRIIKNTFSAHVTSASTPKKEFDETWSVISDVCQRLQIYTGKDYMTELRKIQRYALKEEHEESAEKKPKAREEIEKEERQGVETPEIAREEREKEQKTGSETEEIAKEVIEKEERKGQEIEEIAKEEAEKEEKKGTKKEAEKEEEKGSQTDESAKEEVEREERKESKTEETGIEDVDKEQRKGTETEERELEEEEEGKEGEEKQEEKQEVEEEEEEEEEIRNVDKDIILDDFEKWMCDKHKVKKLHRLYFGTADLSKENINKGDKVIVAVVDNAEGIDKKEPFSHKKIPIPIFWKGWKEDSKKMYVEMVEQQKLQIQHIEKLKAIDKYLDTNSKDLFEKHSNLEMLRASTFRVEKGNVVKEPCIVFYFSCKGVVPFNETRIPNVLGGNKTDVREGFFQSYCNLNVDFCADSKDLLNPLRMGASIGGKERGEGSLGGFVEFKDGSGKEYGFITCAHNIYSPDEMESTELPSTPMPVLQPSLLREGSQICGETVKSVSSFINVTKDNITVDATLVRLRERFSKEHILFAGLLDVRLEKYGFSRSTFPRFIDGITLDLRKQEDRQHHLSQKYLKCGAATGLTVGCLNLICTRIRKDFTDKRHSQNDKKLYQLVYDKQLEIYGEDFAKDGDSGSLVFQVRQDDTSRLQCIGMIVGSNSDEHITAFTPIDSVLEALALDVKLI